MYAINAFVLPSHSRCPSSLSSHSALELNPPISFVHGEIVNQLAGDAVVTSYLSEADIEKIAQDVASHLQPQALPHSLVYREKDPPAVHDQSHEDIIDSSRSDAGSQASHDGSAGASDADMVEAEASLAAQLLRERLPYSWKNEVQ